MADFIDSWISTFSPIILPFFSLLSASYFVILEGMPYAPHRSFLGCNSLFLSLDAGLFVMLAFAQLREYTRLLAQFFEAANRTLDGFVFSDSNSSHNSHHPQSSRIPF